ncbi:hypothetical protein [Thioalkalivibrio sp. ALE6]|uniref:hypothetical protein n=1 Tax=Thioalkalivibrio sp. ALE6 TaxID=1266908 RepID=UPI00038095D2|nr:hypothetical protein [Thioalkalivibrio sp. ALE6]
MNPATGPDDRTLRIGYERCQIGRSGLPYRAATEDPVLHRLMRMAGRAYLTQEQEAPAMPRTDNPFQRYSAALGRVVEDKDAVDRMRALHGFTLEECRAALRVPGLQPRVASRLRARIRTLERDQPEPEDGGAE